MQLAGHLLGECSHRDNQSMHIARHNKAVGLIQDAIASGPLGGSYMVMDACGRDAAPDTVASTRLPPWLLPTMPAHVRDKLRPDILIIEGLPPHAGIALTTASPSLSHLQRSCRIHIIEGSQHPVAGCHAMVLWLGAVTEHLQLQGLQLQYLLPQKQPELCKFFAQWRDVIKGFRVRVVREVSKEYEVWTSSDMAEYLKDEEKLPESQQVYYGSGQGGAAGHGPELGGLGLKEVADMSNTCCTVMHCCQPTCELLSPEQVDCMVMPQHLEHTRGALRKLVQFMSVPARPRKVC